jgi:hypothetical protein
MRPLSAVVKSRDGEISRAETAMHNAVSPSIAIRVRDRITAIQNAAPARARIGAREPVARIAAASKTSNARTKARCLRVPSPKQDVNGSNPARNAATKLGLPRVAKTRIRALACVEGIQPASAKGSAPANCTKLIVATAPPEATEAHASACGCSPAAVNNMSHPNPSSGRKKDAGDANAPLTAAAPSVPSHTTSAV